MASVVLLAAFLLSGSLPVRAQDTRTDQAGSVLREYVDKGYCTYTYVVPPGSRTEPEGCTPPGLESQFAETKEETGRLKNQVDRLSSQVDALLSRADSLSAELSAERVRSAQLVRNLQEQETRVQNLTRKLQEQETRVQNLTQGLQEQETRLTRGLQEQENRLQAQCCSERPTLPPDERPTLPPELEQASDCAEHYAAGRTTSGVYNIRINSSDVETYCDMDTAAGGWTVIQRRQDGSVPFNRTWEEYKQGFGNKSGEYWLGNEDIHLLTQQKAYTLRVDFEDWGGQTRYAEYASFRVSGESDQYRLHISGYSGTAGDSITASHTLNGQKFSTVDRDNDDGSLHCSQGFGQGGWWFRFCGYSYLNGRYLGNCGNSCSYLQGVVWFGWRGYDYSLKSVSMKIRP